MGRYRCYEWRQLDTVGVKVLGRHCEVLMRRPPAESLEALKNVTNQTLVD